MIVAADKAMYVRKSKRKLNTPSASDPMMAELSKMLDDVSNNGPFAIDIAGSTGDGFIVELDETHVIATNSVN